MDGSWGVVPEKAICLGYKQHPLEGAGSRQLKTWFVWLKATNLCFDRPSGLGIECYGCTHI